jgi:hypothetical protein
VPWPDDLFPADPYPGIVPPASFAHVNEVAHPIESDGDAGWRVGAAGIDDWLAEHDAPSTSERLPVLVYGSNRCPSKITWLRRMLGLGADPVVVLRARTAGVAAVWASGLRRRDGQRPAVLASAPGVDEHHAVWLATPEQIGVLDRCEGRDDRYRLARLRTGTVHTEDGQRIERPLVYLGHAATRRPLMVDGLPMRCADVPQHVAQGLSGDPAPTDGLDAVTVHGPISRPAGPTRSH